MPYVVHLVERNGRSFEVWEHSPEELKFLFLHVLFLWTSAFVLNRGSFHGFLVSISSLQLVIRHYYAYFPVYLEYA